MANSLKENNKHALFAVIAVNLVVFVTFVENHQLRSMDLSTAASELTKGIPAVLSLIVVGMINAQIPSEVKARIVYLRWKNALPGCEAFTKYARKDLRVNFGDLDKAHGPLPTSSKKQNALWYKMYRSVEDDPAVINIHREFLFARDYTCIALMALAALGLSAAVEFQSHWVAFGYVVVLILQFIFAGQAARNLGRNLVTTVLALKSAGR